MGVEDEELVMTDEELEMLEADDGREDVEMLEALLRTVTKMRHLGCKSPLTRTGTRR